MQQFVEEGHLRWDSLGELLAVAVSLEDLAAKTGNDDVQVLADALNDATGKLLDNNSPGRAIGDLDNRGSQFYLTLYWAQALAAQDKSKSLKERFTGLAKSLADHEAKILGEIAATQGKPVDIGGYC